MYKIEELIEIKSNDYVKDGIKDKKRVSNHGEVYTPENIVNDMLDLTSEENDGQEAYTYKRLVDINNHTYKETVRKLGNQFLTVDKVFLEPACGNGNFLVAIIERKLLRAILDAKNNKCDIKYGVFKAFATTYGIDILADNIIEARQRMLEEIVRNEELVALLNKENDIENLVNSLKFIMDKNIILGDFLKQVYVADGRKTRRKLNKGIVNSNIKLYNWKMADSDEFDNNGNVEFRYATLSDLSSEESEGVTKHYLDLGNLEDTDNKDNETEDSLDILNVTEETKDTNKKGGRKRVKKTSIDDEYDILGNI